MQNPPAIAALIATRRASSVKKRLSIKNSTNAASAGQTVELKPWSTHESATDPPVAPSLKPYKSLLDKDFERSHFVPCYCTPLYF